MKVRRQNESTERPAGAKWKALAGGAILLAFLARLPFSVLYWMPDDQANNYVTQARDLAFQRHYFSEADFIRLPGAPLFYALCMALTGDHPAIWVAIEHAAGVGIVCLLVVWVWKNWGPLPAVFTGYLLALDFQFPFDESFLLSELATQLYFVLALLLVLSLHREKGPPRFWRWALAGFATALAGLTRGEFLIMGPLAAAGLFFPDGVMRGVGRLRQVGSLLGGWLLLVGGWILCSWIFLGYAGVNVQGPTVLLDGDLPVRYDLPTEALTKRLLLEESARTPLTGMAARPVVWNRLQQEYGYTYLKAGKALGAVAYEAVRTQPGVYGALVLRNLRTYLTPIPWFYEYGSDPFEKRSGIGGRHAAGRLFFREVLSVDQYWGWVVFVLACLSPMVWVYGTPDRRWDLALLWVMYFGLCFDLALVRPAIERYQSTLQLPLALLASCTAAFLSESYFPSLLRKK